MTSITSPNPAIVQTLSAKVNLAKKKISARNQWRILMIIIIALDFFMLYAAFQLAYLIRFKLNVPLFQLWITPEFTFYRYFMLALTPVWMAIFYIMRLYDRERILAGTREYSQVFNATIIGVVLVVSVGFFAPSLVFARGWVVTAWAASFFLVAFGRFFVRRMVYLFRQRGYFLNQAIIVGANEEGRMIAEQLTQWKTSGFHILGFVDKKIPPGERVIKDLTCLGTVEQLDDIITGFAVDELVLASSAVSSRDKMVDIFKNYAFDRNVRVRFSSGLYEIFTTGVSINQFAYVPLMEINPVRLSGVDRAFKFLLDYTLGIVALILASPIMAVLAILIKLDSPGPVIHRRRVVGINGVQFDAFKFRTMHMNGDEILAKYPVLLQELKQNHKLKVDPRVTRVGKVLRKLSLDELPQVFNVLRGEMSLVGPRMITPEEIEKYNKWDMNLLTVRPGITGLWQVSGRSDITYEDRVRLDMYYIRNWTIWLDLQLIIQTIPAVLRSKGAY